MALRQALCETIEVAIVRLSAQYFNRKKVNMAAMGGKTTWR
ncbi:hypothetical protein CHELA1G11_60046 [Hyphomicrobiales bacterium]|nr:hypothetical protein CHELA1G11_60046 [Hyphomicrobiales bacterium]